MKTKQRSIEYNRPWRHNNTWYGLRFVENPSQGLRFVGFADQISKAHGSRRVDHTGWFCDEFQDRTLRGVVYRLPHGRFVPGYVSSDDCLLTHNRRGDWSEPSGVCLAFDDICTADDSRDTHSEAELDAAVLADNLAESVAEDEREYNEAWQAGSRFAQLGADIAEAWASLKKLARERRLARAKGDATAYPTLCEAIKSRAADLWDTIEEARRERMELKQLERWQGDAFRDGCGSY